MRNPRFFGFDPPSARHRHTVRPPPPHYPTLSHYFPSLLRSRLILRLLMLSFTSFLLYACFTLEWFYGGVPSFTPHQNPPALSRLSITAFFAPIHSHSRRRPWTSKPEWDSPIQYVRIIQIILNNSSVLTLFSDNGMRCKKDSLYFPHLTIPRNPIYSHPHHRKLKPQQMSPFL